MAWHMGNRIPQTLFTSIYLNKLLWPIPKTIEEARFDPSEDGAGANPWVHLVLRSYCLALIKSCDFVLARVTSEHYYEVSLDEYATRSKVDVYVYSYRFRKKTLTLNCITAVFSRRLIQRSSKN